MEKCAHKDVCKYVREGEVNGGEAGECEVAVVCRHFSGDGESPKKKDKIPFEHNSRKRGTSISLSSRKNKAMACVKTGGDIKKGFAKAKAYISMNEDELTENQKLALNSLKGKHFTGLTESQVNQVFDIADDLKKALSGK